MAFYDAIPASDGTSLAPPTNAEFKVFEVTDTARANPLPLRTVAGTNAAPLVTTAQGVVPPVEVVSPNFEHIFQSGGWEWRRESSEGMRKAAEEARVAAVFVQQRVESGELNGGPGPQGKQGLPGVNAVPTAEAVAVYAQTPGNPLNTALPPVVGAAFGAVFAASYGLSSKATAAANLKALQAAASAAMAAKVTLWLPMETCHIAGGSIAVDKTLRVQGADKHFAVIQQDTKGLPIFKVDAEGCSFSSFTMAGAGLDVTGLPLNGAKSFRGHCGIWASLRSHDLSVDNVVVRDLVIGVYVRDTMPGEPGSWSANACERLRVSNVHCKNVWVGVEAGPLSDHSIVGVTGNYRYVSGTPTNGDIYSPPHLVYVASDREHPSLGGFYDRISTINNKVNGSPLKIKFSSGFTVGSVQSHASRGILEMETCSNFEILSPSSTDDGYIDIRGSIWGVDCHDGRIKGARINFAEGDHSGAIWFNSECTNVTVEDPYVVARRVTPAIDPHMAMIRVVGSGLKILNPVVRSEGAPLSAALDWYGSDCQIINPEVSGKFKYAITGSGKRGIVDYDPLLNLSPRDIEGAKPLLFTSIDAPPTIRDRSAGQTSPIGFADNFLTSGRIVAGNTDSGKVWQHFGYDGPGTGSWTVDSKGLRYDGGSARGVLVVDGGKSNGTLQARINGLPTADEGYVIRAQDANNYIAVAPYATTNDYRIRITKRVAGVATIVATSDVQGKVGDTIAITASGTTISVALNGANLLTATIEEFLTVKTHGVLGLSGSKALLTSSISFS